MHVWTLFQTEDREQRGVQPPDVALDRTVRVHRSLRSSQGRRCRVILFSSTSGWLALLNASDSLHSAASSAWARLLDRNGRVVLTDWIVVETGNGLARSSARSRFATAVELIRSSPRADLIHVSPALFERALELYTRRFDKTWGLVDCAS